MCCWMEDEKGVRCTRYDRAVCGSMRGKKNWDAREGVPKGEIGLPGCDPVGPFSLCALHICFSTLDRLRPAFATGG